MENQKAVATTELSATGRRHARTLVPEIGELVDGINLHLHDIDAFAVSIGPGSFTGLRVGVVCAKTLAYSLNKPLLAVDTFEAVAAAHGSFIESNTNRLVWVIDDALRGDVYAGRYKFEEGNIACLQKPRLIAVEQFRTALASDDIVTGPGVAKLDEDLIGLDLGPENLRTPQAVQIALIGEQRLSAGDVDNPWSVEPHYIRRSAAEEKADAAT